MAQCPTCRQCFISENARDQHVRDKIHVKTIPCDTCGRKFGAYPHLRQHEESGYHERHPKASGRKTRKTRSRSRRRKKEQAVVQPQSLSPPMMQTPSPYIPVLNHFTRPSSITRDDSSNRNSFLNMSSLSKTLPSHRSNSTMQPSVVPFKRAFTENQTTEQLNRYVVQHLQSDEEWHRKCNSDMDYLASYLKNNSTLNVAETIKGGSLSKGTDLKSNSDLDVVVFINDYDNMDDFRNGVKSTLETLKYEVKEWAKTDSNNVQVQGTTPHAVQCRIRNSTSNKFIDVDILPAMNIAKRRAERVYEQLNDMCSHKREYFSSALTELQRDFVKEQEPNVKNVIKLMKHWRDVNFERCPLSGKPSSYLLELLTINSWERAGRPSTFDTKKAFKSTLGMLKDHDNIDAKWEKNYRTYKYSNSASKEFRSPFILDPANPFNNVCNRVRDWEGISEKARSTMEGPLLRDVSLPYHSWD